MQRCPMPSFPGCSLGRDYSFTRGATLLQRSENGASTCEEPLPSVSFASSPASSRLSRLDTRLARARTMPDVRHYLDLGHLRRLECVVVLVSLASRTCRS